MYSTFTKFLLLTTLLALPSPVAHDLGQITGHVKNPAGKPIQSAQVIVVGTAFGAVTDSAGAYSIGNVPAGIYTIRAQFIGFAPTEVVGVRVTGGSTTTQDIRLQPSASVVSGITVVAAANPIVPRDEVRSSVTLQLGQAQRAFVDGAPANGYAAKSIGDAQAGVRDRNEPWNTEGYNVIDENPFLAVSAHPLSTFSSDVDRASYSNVRRFLLEGQLPPKDAVRIEELVNYFPYDYAGPTDDAPVAIHSEVAPAPWNPRHQLVRIGLQARRIETENLPPSNLVFLIDVSGSMDEPNKLPLVKAAFHLLVQQLRHQDRVAIVVYAGNTGLVLPSTPGDDKETIERAIDSLEAGGSTAGGAGIKRAYQEAVTNFITGGNNRVILATDGDFNVGVSSDAELVRLIEDERKTGVFLTALGFGEGNLKDGKMEQLADHGNGNYAYIDNLFEAKKTFVHEMGATLFTVAKDVKIQVEFNPARVQGYRLIGYEDRLLRDEDFADDKKDAGDMGAGHSVTALYEIVPAGVEPDVDLRVPDSLRYQHPAATITRDGGELLYVKVRYKAPAGDVSKLLSLPVPDRVAENPSPDFRFQTAVVEFGLLLRESAYRGSARIEDVVARAREVVGADPEGYRTEFVRLAKAAQSIGLPLDGAHAQR